MEIEGAKVVVVGMARSGVAAVELLHANRARVSATDQKPLTQLGEAATRLRELGVPFAQQSPEVILSGDILVISPGVPADLGPLNEARRRGILVIGEVELASRYLQGKVIGITGTNGKTTTTALVGHLLEDCGIPCQVGGNIGKPLCGMVASSRPDKWNVLELSSFQLETIRRFRANIGVALNVTPDHLDRHHSIESYIAEKARLFENQQASDFAVLNAGDFTTATYAARSAGAAYWFSLARPVTPGIWFEGGTIVLEGEPLIEASRLRIRGEHNIENAMAAAMAARLAGAEPSAIARSLTSFEAVEHRLEFVRDVEGVSYYNDSKATNVDATLKSLSAFTGSLWVILGGKDKESDYRPLAEAMRSKTKAALLIGAAAGKIAGQLAGAVPVEHCGTLDAAVRHAHRAAAPGDTVLLAPACASFDQFESYEHRGRVFKSLVGELAGK